METTHGVMLVGEKKNKTKKTDLPVPIPPVVGAFRIFVVIHVVVGHQQVFPPQLVFVVVSHVGADSKAERRRETISLQASIMHDGAPKKMVSRLFRTNVHTVLDERLDFVFGEFLLAEFDRGIFKLVAESGRAEQDDAPRHAE